MSVKGKVSYWENSQKDREEEDQQSKSLKSTQTSKGQQDSNLIQGQSEKPDQDHIIRESDVIKTLNKMFNDNPQVRDHIEGQLEKQSQMSSQLEDDWEEDNEKNDQLYSQELIQQVNDQELQSEDRIYVGMITNEFTSQMKKSKRLSMDLQSISIPNRTQSILQSKLIFNDQNQLILVQDDSYYLEQLDKIIYIQRYIKCKLTKEKKEKEKQLIEKMNRYRINVLNELIQTEVKYVADLEILNAIKIKLAKQFSNKKDDIKMMFNIHEILKFNTEFLSELQKKNNLKDPNAIVMDSIVPLLNGFIFYYEYCKAYEQARKITTQYEAIPAFQQCIKDIEVQNLLKGLSLNDYTIKPVQRLPKYVLLFKDLLKHTMQSHPDYQNVKNCLETIEKINDKNNSEMDVYLKQAKLIELYQQFGNIQNLTIFEPNIYFIFEDICSIYTKKIEQRIIIYAFNNLLLFAKINKQNSLEYQLHIPITHLSFIKDIKDLLIIKNSFEFVNRNETIIIVNEDSKTKEILKTKIQLIINSQKEIFESKIDKKQDINNICVKVEILGTESDPKFDKNITFYKTNFTIDTIQITSLIRFSQVVSLTQLVNKYDSKLKIPTIAKSLSSKSQKVIDERKLRMEQLLQIILNSPQIIQNSEYQRQVLEILNLDTKFYSLPEQMKQKPELFQHKAKLRQQKNQKNSNLEFLHSFQEEKFRSKISEDDKQIKIGQEAANQPYCIEIMILTGQTLQVGFKKNTTTWFIKNAVANQINLKCFVDFKIFIVDTAGIIRVIEDDEKISTILDTSKTGFLKSLKNMFINGTKFQFIFRKYLYLPWRQEELEYQQDEVRLKCLMFEIVFLAKDQTFPLSFIDFCLMTAFYSIATQQKIDRNLLKKAIPACVIKQHTEKIWLEQIQREVAYRENQLLEFQTQSQKKDPNKKNYSIQSLSSLLMVTCFQTNVLFGMQLFFVECSKETIQMVQQKEFGIKLSYQVLIGLNFNGLHFIKPENRTWLGRIDFKLITEIKSFPIEFVCKINDCNLKFKTQTPYEIKHLILEYQQINEILNS